MNCAVAFDWPNRNRWTALFLYISIFLIFESVFGIFYWRLLEGVLKFKNDNKFEEYNYLNILLIFGVSIQTITLLPFSIEVSWNHLALINRTIFGVS